MTARESYLIPRGLSTCVEYNKHNGAKHPINFFRKNKQGASRPKDRLIKNVFDELLFLFGGEL
jgi:hypothetical protein